MLKHIVAWKIQEENKAANMRKMKEMFESLVGKIDVIKSMQVGFNENGGKYDVVLVTDFPDKHDHEQLYDNHPRASGGAQVHKEHMCREGIDRL